MSFFLPFLKAYGHLENLPIVFGNVGSRKVNEDRRKKTEWSMFGSNLTIYGFDADKMHAPLPIKALRSNRFPGASNIFL